jgi:trimeric autotransporter adhesin
MPRTEEKRPKRLSATSPTSPWTLRAIYTSPRAREIKRVKPNGIIDTVAGTGSIGSSGDGGPANQATLNFPAGLATDAAGNLYIAEYTGDRVRKVFTDGTIATIAANGSATADGSIATQFALVTPQALAVDKSGNLYIGEQLGNRVVKVTPDGLAFVVAGRQKLKGFFGDGGAAVDASFDLINGIAVDTSGNLYVADSNNNRIREIVTASPSFQVSASSLNFAGRSNGSLVPPQRINVSSGFPGLVFSVDVSTVSGGSWLVVGRHEWPSPRSD